MLTTEGIKVYDGGKPYTAILMGGGGYRGGLKEAEQSVITANQVAAIKGVQVNLQVHSWAEPNGYPGGGVLERAMMMKNRKARRPASLRGPGHMGPARQGRGGRRDEGRRDGKGEGGREI